MILSITDFVQFGLGWPVWLAAAGVLGMLLLLILIPLARRPQASGLMARTLMKGATLHDRLLVGFRLVAAVPILMLLPLLAMISTMTVRDAQLPQIERLAASIEVSVPQLLQSRITGIESVAGHMTSAGRSDADSLREMLMRHHASNLEFASLWIARRSGDIVGASAARKARIEPWAGPVSGVAMMDSFKRAVIDGGLYVSPVRKGAAADEAPMIFVSAPISLDGDPQWGYVQGLLNLKNVTGGLVNQGSIDSVSAVITDQRNRVILASPGLALMPFSDLSVHPLMREAASVPPGRVYSFSGIVNNDGKSAQYMAVNKKLDNGWQVYATATQAKAGITVLIYMALGLIWALLALMLARGLAPLYGEVVVQPLQKLEESLEVFDAARTITIMPPAPNDAPQEIRQAYARVRESMQNSRDAYRNMLKVVNEGNELRNKLRSMSGSVSQKIRAVKPNHGDKPGAVSEDSLEALGSNDETIVAERIAGGPKLELAQDESTSGEYSAGGHDSVTGLPGQDVFEGFFGEAWTLGATDSRPISVIIVRVDETDNERLGLVADKLKVTAARTLDLVARITKWDFGLVLPDTDLEGALALASRLREELQEQDVVISFGVASIVPNNNGNAQSFLDICNRAVAAARQKGDGQIAFVSEKGKLMLHLVPEAPEVPKNSKFDMIDWDTGEEASA